MSRAKAWPAKSSVTADPCVLALPLMALAVWWGVGRGLRPVNALAQSRDARRAGPGTARRIDYLTNEIAPLRHRSTADPALTEALKTNAVSLRMLRTNCARRGALKVQAQVRCVRNPATTSSTR